MTSPSRRVTDAEVEAYFPVIRQLASQLASSSVAKQAGAEYDDLFQEGSIFVWQTLQKNIDPAKDMIRKRMLNWVRYLQRHDNLSYEEIVEQDRSVSV